MRTNYDYLRPEKAKLLKQIYDYPLEKREELRYLKLPRATILPLRNIPEDGYLFGRGGVIDENGKYVKLSGIERRVSGAYDFHHCDHREKTVVYCGYLINHWGHFLIEAVSRLWYFLQNDPEVDSYVFFIEENVDRKVTGNYVEFLELLGVWDKVEIINSPTKYDRVIIPEMGYYRRPVLGEKWDAWYSPLYLSVFRTVVQNTLKTSAEECNEHISKKVFLSRSRLKKAKHREFYLDSLDEFFSANGYTVIYPEAMSLGEMILLLQNAEIVASTSGSLPHNVLFCKPGTEVVLAERLPINNEIQTDINEMMDLKVTYVDVCFSIYPTQLEGPIIYGYTKCLDHFADDSNMVKCNKNREINHLRAIFAQYMRVYRRWYGLKWFSAEMFRPYYGALREAYEESEEVFYPFLNRDRPYRPLLFLDRHYLLMEFQRIMDRFKHS